MYSTLRKSTKHRYHNVSGPLLVKDGLAYTPTDVATLTSRGVAVSCPSASLFCEGSANCDFDVVTDVGFTRGYDIVSAYDNQMEARSKARQALHDYGTYVNLNSNPSTNGESS